MEKVYPFQNQQKSNNNQSFPLAKDFNQNYNKFQPNKNIEINKDSYLFLHSKKFLTKTPVNEIGNNNNNANNNNFHQIVDYTEPQPQLYQNLNLNNNNGLDYQNAGLILSNNNNNINFSNQTKNKKLLEEYFKLKNENNSFNYNYYTYNNNIYKPNTNKTTNNNIKNLKNIQPESQYHPLAKKKKIQKKQNNQNNPSSNNNDKNHNKNIITKKSTSLSRIYQPDKNMNHSPSFTPIKHEISLKQNEITKYSPYFGSKINSNSNIDIKTNQIKNTLNSQRITQSEESNNHIKSIIKNKNYIFQKENNKKTKTTTKINNIIKKPITPLRQNLTPSRKEVQTCFDFKKQKFITKKGEPNYALVTNLTSTSYNNISSINSTETYWKRKDKEKRKKIEQIKTERMLKEEKELQEKPKININSKRILERKFHTKTDVFDRLSDLSQIQHHNANIDKIRERFKETHTPIINNNSKKMKRTIDDLYKWKNKNDRKKIESAKYLNKINKKKIKINPQSEEILKERKSDYINKKVEDRLLEQGRLQQYKNEVQREQYLNYISKSKKYINNEYMNVHSRYLESPNISKENNAVQKGNKSCDRILISKGNKINYKTFSLRNNLGNNINMNNDESFDNKSDMNYSHNAYQNKKQIYFDNNNGSNLINGNINNYIINNNYNNNIMLKPPKNQIVTNDNLINKHYQYFPDYNSKRNSESQQYNNNLIKNNNIEPKNYINFHTEKAVTDKKINSNNSRVINMNSNNQQNEIINIRKHLNEFYENKKNKKVQSNNVENYLSKMKNQLNDESIKNGILKGLLDNGNNNNNENIKSKETYNYQNNNDKINQNCDDYIINNTDYNKLNQGGLQINSLNSNNIFPSNNDNINQNEVAENKSKYNFKPELLKDINKIPKSSGLNFEQSKNKNFNYFQFNFERNENKNNDNDLNINKANFIEKSYEYIQNNNEKKDILYNSNNNNLKNNNKDDKYSIEDSVKINNFQNNINMNNNNYNYNYNNYEELEKERRKQDLMQMINFSSNLKINNNNNSNYIIEQNMQNNNNDYENYNIVQSYEET